MGYNPEYVGPEYDRHIRENREERARHAERCKTYAFSFPECYELSIVPHVQAPGNAETGTKMRHRRDQLEAIAGVNARLVGGIAKALPKERLDVLSEIADGTNALLKMLRENASA